MSGTIATGGGQAIHGVIHSKLAFDMPRLACDCHVHVMGKPPRYPYVSDSVCTPGIATPEALMAHRFQPRI